jgi:hypothetical protein
MLKSTAIAILGGSVAAAANALGVTYQAVCKWPEDSEGPLPARIADRVIAASARRNLSAEDFARLTTPQEADEAGAA